MDRARFRTSSRRRISRRSPTLPAQSSARMLTMTWTTSSPLSKPSSTVCGWRSLGLVRSSSINVAPSPSMARARAAPAGLIHALKTHRIMAMTITSNPGFCSALWLHRQVCSIAFMLIDPCPFYFFTCASVRLTAVWRLLHCSSKDGANLFAVAVGTRGRAHPTKNLGTDRNRRVGTVSSCPPWS